VPNDAMNTAAVLVIAGLAVYLSLSSYMTGGE
jgi:hypothetical protein